MILLKDSKLGIKSGSEYMRRLLDSRIRKKRISPVSSFINEKLRYDEGKSPHNIASICDH